MYGILIDKGIYGRSKQEVRGLLKSEYGIDTREFFYPMHKQPVMINKGYAKETAKLPVCEKLWENGFYLPSSTNIKESQIAFIADALKALRKTQR
jgi:perosamine synthetase